MNEWYTVYYKKYKKKDNVYGHLEIVCVCNSTIPKEKKEKLWHSKIINDKKKEIFYGRYLFIFKCVYKITFKITITQRLCWSRRNETKNVKDPTITNKRKRNVAMYGIVHPPIIGDTFYFATKYNLKKMF